MLEESRGRVYPNAREKLPWITQDLWKKSAREASGVIFSGPEALEWTPATFAAINGERSGLAC